MSILEEMILFARECQDKLDSGMSLKQLSQWSFQQREAGRSIPYLGISDKANGRITRLTAAPTTKQGSLWQFFNNTYADGSALPMYQFYVEDKVYVTSKQSKGMVPLELLY